MVIEPGQDMSSYGPGGSGGEGDASGTNGGNTLQQPPDGGILSVQQQGGNIPPMNTGDPSHGPPRFPTTPNQMFMSSRKFFKHTHIVSKHRIKTYPAKECFELHIYELQFPVISNPLIKFLIILQLTASKINKNC